MDPAAQSQETKKGPEIAAEIGDRSFAIPLGKLEHECIKVLQR